MIPLTLDDLLPLDEYAIRRTEFFAQHRRYLDRYRRVRLGPDVSIIFENRQTIWYKLQEILRVARLAEPARVQRELDWYNAILPGRDRLRASMVIDAESARIAQLMREWANFRGSDLYLLAGRERIDSRLMTSRPEDAGAGAQLLEFVVGPNLREVLADGTANVGCEIKRLGYEYRAILPAAVRQSLADDLALSDRDAA